MSNLVPAKGPISNYVPQIEKLIRPAPLQIEKRRAVMTQASSKNVSTITAAPANPTIWNFDFSGKNTAIDQAVRILALRSDSPVNERPLTVCPVSKLFLHIGRKTEKQLSLKMPPFG